MFKELVYDHPARVLSSAFQKPKELVCDQAAQMLSYSLQKPEGRKLTPEGSKALQQLAKKVLLGREKFKVADEAAVLQGYKIESEGFEKLKQDISQKGHNKFLVLANHFSNCPVGIVSNAIALENQIHDYLDINPVIIFGTGLSPLALVRGLVQKTTDDVLLAGGWGGNKHASTLVNKMFTQNKSVLVYPEGKNSYALIEGDFRTGRIAISAAAQGIPTFGVGICYLNNTFYLQASRLVEPDEIKSLKVDLGENILSRDERRVEGQQVIDYLMRNTIRDCLPLSLWGRYE